MEGSAHSFESTTAGYVLVPERSRFTVQSFATGPFSGFAHNPTFAVRAFSGMVRFSPTLREASSIELTVKADSLELLDEVSDKDRAEIQTTMRKKVLETEQYPEIRFYSTAVETAKVTENWYRLLIDGRLAPHGVTQAHQIEARLQTAFREGFMSGESTLSLSAFNIAPVAALGGLIKLKDELKIAFDLFARREEENAS